MSFRADPRFRSFLAADVNKHNGTTGWFALIHKRMLEQRSRVSRTWFQGILDPIYAAEMRH